MPDAEPICKKRMANKGLPHYFVQHLLQQNYAVSTRSIYTRAGFTLPVALTPASDSGDASVAWFPDVLAAMPETFSTRYAALMAAGKIEADPGQAVLARHLEALEHRLDRHRLAQKSSALGWLFGRREKSEAPLKGLYVYGEVGRGKTMLMDLFFETSSVRAQAPRPFPRIHGRRA